MKRLEEKKGRDTKHKDDNACPKQGERYGIGRSKLSNKEAKNPYHLGFVVYNKNGVNIALEGFTGQHDKHRPIVIR